MSTCKGPGEVVIERVAKQHASDPRATKEDRLRFFNQVGLGIRVVIWYAWGRYEIVLAVKGRSG